MPPTSSFVALVICIAALGTAGASDPTPADACEASIMAPDTRRMVLTSNGLNTKPIRDAFVGMLGRRLGNGRSMDDARVLYIPDAIVAEGTSASEADAHFRRSLRPLNITHVTTVCLETAGYDGLRDAFSAAPSPGYDVVYVECGNTFALHYHMHQTRFMEIAAPTLDGGCVYVGSSAGSIVAGKTASIALWKGWDDPSVVPKVDPSYAGLDLARGKSFFPHFGPQWTGLVRERSAKEDHPIVTLRDDQAFVSDESGERLVPAQ